MEGKPVHPPCHLLYPSRSRNFLRLLGHAGDANDTNGTPSDRTKRTVRSDT